MTARYISKNCLTEIRTIFLSVISLDDNGAKGLLVTTTTILSQSNLSIENLVGVMADGEAANTGKNAGLWKMLQDHIGHKLLTIWCTYHRSDLTMESVISSVSEMKIWLINLNSIPTYFHTASL